MKPTLKCSAHCRIMLFHSSHSVCHETLQPDCEMWLLWAPEGLSADSIEKSTKQKYENKLDWLKYYNGFFFFSPCFGHPTACVVPGPEIRSELQLQPMPQLWQHWILNPLCRAMDQTCTPQKQHRILNPLCHSGNS